MIVLSSFRPHKASAAYRENQIRAHESWEAFASEIVYFGDYEAELAGEHTTFIPSENWPRISVMAECASAYRKPVAIVNSDIVLEPEVKRVFEVVAETSIGGATSRRFCLETRELDPADHGRDIFICKPRVWKAVANEIPHVCRIGHQRWDSWLVGFLRKKRQFGDFTQMRVVFHPTHEERQMPHADEIEFSGPYEGFWDGTQDKQIL